MPRYILLTEQKPVPGSTLAESSQREAAAVVDIPLGEDGKPFPPMKIPRYPRIRPPCYPRGGRRGDETKETKKKESLKVQMRLGQYRLGRRRVPNPFVYIPGRMLLNPKFNFNEVFQLMRMQTPLYYVSVQSGVTSGDVECSAATDAKASDRGLEGHH
jgi:hypothetical protein